MLKKSINFSCTKMRETGIAMFNTQQLYYLINYYGYNYYN